MSSLLFLVNYSRQRLLTAKSQRIARENFIIVVTNTVPNVDNLHIVSHILLFFIMVFSAVDYSIINALALLLPAVISSTTFSLNVTSFYNFVSVHYLFRFHSSFSSPSSFFIGGTPSLSTIPFLEILFLLFSILC